MPGSPGPRGGPRLVDRARGAAHRRLERQGPRRRPRRLVLRVPQRLLSRLRRHREVLTAPSPRRIGRRRRRGRTSRRSGAASPGCWGCRTTTAAGAPSTAAATTRSSPRCRSPTTTPCSTRARGRHRARRSSPSPAGYARRPRSRAGRRLPPPPAGGRRQLVRPLGLQLHLRHLAGASGLASCGDDLSRALVPAGGRLAASRTRMPTAAGASRPAPTTTRPARASVRAPPSQTAWALHGVVRCRRRGGIRRLAPARAASNTSSRPARRRPLADEPWTGTGFPKVFYLRYHLYATTSRCWAWRNTERSAGRLRRDARRAGRRRRDRVFRCAPIRRGAGRDPG